MKKIILFISLFLIGLMQFSWGESYIIELKNGNELSTSRYWIEGDEMKFYIYGGVGGIKRDLVGNIRISDTSLKGLDKEDVNSVNTGELTKETPKGRFQSEKSTFTRENEKDQKVDLEVYRDRKESLKRELEAASQRNREATANKDREGKERTRQEMLGYSKQIIDLGDELKRKNKGILPDWWEE